MRATAVLGVLLALASTTARAASPPGTPIVNVARGVYAPGSGGAGTVEAPSNTVTTVVAATTTFDPLRLAVTPQGPVAPGTLLDYTITAVNRSGADLPDAVFRLPLDPELLDPDGIAPGAVSPAQLAVTAVWDASARTAIWTVSSAIPAGQTVTLSLRARVRSDATTDQSVVETASASSSLSLADLPSNTVLTPIVEPLLRMTKVADRPTVAPGDGVGFELTVTHVGTAAPLGGVVAVDVLPDALRYVAGTTRIDGLASPDPAISADGRTLRFALPDLQPGDARAIRFGARVGPTAKEGEVVNRSYAQAVTQGGFDVVSATASAPVRVVPGPFRQEATVVGRVFVDDDGDGIPDPGEPGVPGALVTFEDGRAVVTDVAGRWHVEAVRPGLHVLRVDPASLPAPLEASHGGGDFAGGRGSRFLEARASGLVIADLPVGPGGSPRCAITSGRAGLDLPVAVLTTDAGAAGPRAAGILEAAAAFLVDQGEFNPGAATLVCDGEGAETEALQITLREAVRRRVGAAPPETPVDDPEDPPSKDPLEELVRHAPQVAAIAYPADGARASRGMTHIEVVYPVGARLDVRVNGDLLGMDLVGATSTLPARRLSASRFVGVALRPGPNLIEFRATPPGADPSAIVPVRSTVYLPGATVAFAIEPVEARCVANGVTPCSVRILALDQGGMRTAESPTVTLVVEGARPIDPDLDPRTDGIQVRLEDGLSVVRLTPPSTPGRIRVFAGQERSTAEAFLDAVPAAGDWRVVGLAEAHVAGGAGMEGDGGLPPGVVENITDDGARLALFAQGPVLAKSHLTVAVDTARPRDPYRLFDRFRPDAFFPVQGDAATPLDQAPRQGPFFARLDGPKGFVAAGDYETGFIRTELARYDRRLTGAWGRVGDGRVALEAFAAATDQSVVRDVFSPDGTSGPYLLSRRPVVAYSQSVILELRDRWRPEEVLHRIVKQPDLDYALDPEAGTILFRGPVEPFDADANPYRIVVLYEARSGASDQLAAGVRLLGHPTSELDTGLTAVHEGHDGADLGIYGLDLTWRPMPGTTVAAEVAATRQDGDAEVAYRLEAVSQATEALRWEARYEDVPAGFANPTYLSSPETGGTRGSGNVTWQSTGPWRVKGEAIWQASDAGGLQRTVGAVATEHRTDRLTWTAAARGVAFDAAGTSQSSLLLEAGVRGKLSTRWTGELFRAQVVAGEVTPGYPNRTVAGVAWDIREGRRLVLRHEIESGGDAPTRDRTVAGLESRIGANTRALVSYALEGGASGTSLRATSGLETVLPLSARSSLFASAAIVDTTRGDGSADFVALAGGYEYRAGSSLVSARYEVNFNHVDVRHLVGASGVFRATDPWTLFVRETVFLSDPASGTTAARAEGLFGAAYRPASGPFQFLARVDHTQAEGTPRSPGGVTPGGALSQPAGALGTPARDAGAPGLGTDYARYGAFASRDSVALNLAAGLRFDDTNRLASTLIAKHAGREVDTAIGASRTWLLSVHYTTWIRDRWTLGASVRRFTEHASGLTSYGHGVELGYLAMKNLWVAGGYNFAGFEDRDFGLADRTERGPFLSLRFKFDEGSLASIRDLRLDRP